MTTVMPTLCASCKHFKKGGTCAAFTSGIPADILIYGGDHRQLWPDQEGLVVHDLQGGEEETYEEWYNIYVSTIE